MGTVVSVIGTVVNISGVLIIGIPTIWYLKMQDRFNIWQRRDQAIIPI
jgi:hypothetical protein